MVATLCLFSCVLATAQPADRPPVGPPPAALPQNPPAVPLSPRLGEGSNREWQLGPKLGRAQELVYRGSFSEEALGSGVQFNRAYRVESRVFILDATNRGLETAFFTVLKQRGGPNERSEDTAPSSVRLELGRVDGQGRLEADPGVSLLAPLEGPATLECGAFVETPRDHVHLDQTWQVSEEGRPMRSWQVIGTEMVNGTSCLKLTGNQQSDDWDHPRADRTAWRRQDTVWLGPRLGVAYRVERVIERREPARDKPTQKSVLRYELESSLPYPQKLYEDRRQEITQAHAFWESAAPLLAQPGKFGPQLEVLQAKITHHLDRQPPTPYREAVLQVKRRVEAARRGESPPTPLPEPAPQAARVAVNGVTAPDFTATDFGTRELVHLQHWLGKPVVLLFYAPNSPTAEDLLRFAQTLEDTYKGQVNVLGMAMSDDGDAVRKQRDALHVTFPLLNGSGLRFSYAIEATPKVVLLDATGVVRSSYVGWGSETPIAVVEDVKRWLPGRK
jgi:peroxiredoxin